jgi:CRISPR/Cas system CMR-associated protein Cmr3 (group 5 of RAMP superfamily)
MSDEQPGVRLRIISNEQIVHSQIRSLQEILKREVDVKVTLNKNRTGSSMEFNVHESEISLLKDRLGYSLHKKIENGWIPVK